MDNKMVYVADFESTTNPEDCRVWGWAAGSIIDEKENYVGTTIESFMDWCENGIEGNALVYFCNLKFDSQFIINWLLFNDYKHVKKSKDRATKTFTTIISDKGFYYCIEIIFWKKGKNIRKVTIWDSMKLLPFGVEGTAKAFRLPYGKLKIDYDCHNNLPYGAPITKEEEAYIIRDVRIVAHGVRFLRENGLDKMTIGACALAEYKQLIGEDTFKRWFPPAQYHDDVKPAYKGGYTYLDEKFIGKTVKNGVVLDYNSIYPFVLKTKPLPYGTPIFFKGKYENDKVYPLYTQMLRCQFELKPGKLPMIQIKKSLYSTGNEYLKSSNDEILTFCLNGNELELFLENYKVYNLEYLSGWKFKAAVGMFDAYIDKWNAIKIESKAEENWGMYLLAKLFLNSLGGKFGAGKKRVSKVPYLDDDGVTRYKLTDEEPAKGIYVELASYMTSYAREMIVRDAQRIKDDYAAGRSKIEYIYSDTDSLHLKSDDFAIPEWIEIDQFKLGSFKFESKFIKGKFLRSKCYIEQSTEDVYGENPEYSLKVTVAGMPPECHELVTFNNFKIGAVYKGKKVPKAVKGGVILENIDFTINP